MFRSLFLSVFILSLFSGCGLDQQLVAENPWLLAEGQRPMIIGHGGAKALWPENTLLAMEGAAALGVDALEMDVSMTADEVLVLQHDATIDRHSDGTGAVIDYT